MRVYRAQVPDEVQLEFDYRDTGLAPFIAIRVGETVAVASLLDWGAMDSIDHPTFQMAEQLALDPTQFTELAAFGAYTAMNFNPMMAMAAKVVLEQRIHRWRRVAVRERHAQDTGRLVDNEQQVVLEENL